MFKIRMSSGSLTIRLKFILNRGKDFDYIQEWYGETKELAELFGKRFNNIEEIEEKISGERYYIPKQKLIDFQNIPFTIKEWPIYYRVNNPSCNCRLEVAKIEAIME